MVMGSPYYIAPEQASDTKKAGPLVDIYSLGCVLFHMLAGAPPFAGATHLEVVLKHIRDPIPDLSQVAPSVPVSLSPIVAKMMAKDPKDRFANPSEIRHALQPLLQPEASRQDQEPERHWRGLRLLKFVGPGLLILGLGVSLHWCGRDKPVLVPPTKEAPVATASAVTPESSTATHTAQPEAAPAKPQHRPRKAAAEPSSPWLPRESPHARSGGLFDALEARDTEHLRALLDRGAQPNVADGQFSPLHEAVRLGEPRFVRMLLEKGANPNARDFAGETPLHHALHRRDREMVSALLDFGANPNLPDRMGMSPLQAAGSDGYLVRKLLEKGAR